MKNKSKRFRTNSSQLDHFSLGRKFSCLNVHDLAADRPLVFNLKLISEITRKLILATSQNAVLSNLAAQKQSWSA